MRRQFNKDTHIVVTGENGAAVNIERRLIKSFEPTNDEDAAKGRGSKSVIAHWADDGKEAETETKVRENCEEILAMLKDGKPSAHHTHAWEREIIDARRADAERGLEQVAEGEAYLSFGPDHRRSGAYASTREARQAIVDEIDEKFGASRRLTVARALYEYGKREASSIWGAMADRAASLLAGRSAPDLDKRDANAIWAERFERARATARDQEIDLHKTEGDRLAANRERLERLRDDPQMTPDDRARLDQKINDFTRDHADPDFRYTPDVTNGRIEIQRQESGERQSPSQKAGPQISWIEKHRRQAAEKAEAEPPEPSGPKPSRSQRMGM